MTEMEAQEVANGLIQAYVTPDQRVRDMPSFYRVLVQALQAAHQQGWDDHAEAESPSRGTRRTRFGG